MSRVALDLDGGEPPAAPKPPAQSIRLSRGALELAAGRTGVLLPWQETPPARPTVLEAALGPVAPPAGSAPDPDVADATRELQEAGLLTASPDASRVAAPLERLLVLLATGDVRVDADLAVRRQQAARGAVRLRSWHRRHPHGFVAVSTADGRTVELTWGPDDTWAPALTRLATVIPEPATGEGRSPATLLELPWELLLAAGGALRAPRDDLLHALVRSTDGTVRIADDPAGPTRPATEAETAAQLQLLHRAECGHLQATVGGVGSTGRRTLGLVSWSLFPDGWRSLTPAPGGSARVLVRGCGPDRLAAEVAAHAAGVRS